MINLVFRDRLIRLFAICCFSILLLDQSGLDIGKLYASDLKSGQTAIPATNETGKPEQIERSALKLLLDDDDLFNPVNRTQEQRDALARAELIALEAFENEATKSNSAGQNGDLQLYNWALDDQSNGVQFSYDPDTGLGTVNVYDQGDVDTPPLDLAVPVVTFDDEDDLFFPATSPDNEADSENSPDQAQQEPQLQLDPDHEPSLLAEEDFQQILGSITGIWEISGGPGRPEIWMIEAGDAAATQVLANKRDIETRIDDLETEIRRLKKRGTEYVWERASGPIEKIRQKRFKRLDIDQWNYLGEEISTETQTQMDKHDAEILSLGKLMSRAPNDSILDESGFEQLKYQGSQKLDISVVKGDCDWSMTEAYFDGRTLGAKTTYTKTCMMNTELPSAIKQGLLSYNAPKTHMLRVTQDPRSQSIMMKGRDWHGRVHHSTDNVTINKVENLVNSNALDAKALTPALKDDEEACGDGDCERLSCDYKQFLLSQALTKEKIYDQYLAALREEEKALSDYFEILLGNSKLSASHLDAVRSIAHLTQIGDEMLGALAEANGFINLMHGGSALKDLKEDPVDAWETIKDVASFINRAENALTDLDKNVESLRYTVDPKLIEQYKKTPDDQAVKDAIFNQKSLDDWPNPKALEDAIIDLADIDRFSSKKYQVPGLGSTTLSDVNKWLREQLKTHSSNLADARTFRDAGKHFLIQSQRKHAQSLLKQARAMKAAGDIQGATRAVKQYGKQMDRFNKSAGGLMDEPARKSAFAAVQIALRLAKTYFVEPKLKELRDRIIDLRRELPAAVNQMLKVKDEVADLKKKYKAYEELREDARQAVRDLSDCMAETCGAALANVKADAVADLERRRDSGKIRYGVAKDRLDAQLESMESDAKLEFAREQGREKQCTPYDQTIQQALTPQEGSKDHAAKCEACAEYTLRARALQRQLDFLWPRWLALEGELRNAPDIASKRKRISDQMLRDQKTYLDMVKPSALAALDILDEYYLPLRVPLRSEKYEQDQVLLHNKMMEARSELDHLRRQQKEWDRKKAEHKSLADELKYYDEQLQEVLVQKTACESQWCGK